MLAPHDCEIKPERGQYRGYLVDLLDALAKHASFTYTLYAVHDRQRGSRRQDGTWTGLVGELIAGVSAEINLPPNQSVSQSVNQAVCLTFRTHFVFFDVRF